METERLLLRPWVENDAEELYNIASDPELGPRAGWSPHKDVQESHIVINSFFANDSTWAMVLKKNGRIVGCIGYLKADQSNLPLLDNEGEVGYWVARKYWNQGLCSEGLKAVIDYCFDQLNYTRLWGTHFVDNPASGRVMEKCRFVPTGDTTTLPKLMVGGDKDVRVMNLSSPHGSKA